MKIVQLRTMSLIIGGAVILTAISFWIYSARSPDQPSGTTPSSYAAFSSKASTGSDHMFALIGGDVLIGKLTSDKLQLANGQSWPVQSNNLTSVTVLLPHNALMQATGHAINETIYSGNFSITQDGKTLASGVWSATPVQNPHTTVGYEFLDDSAGVDYSGALVLGTTHGDLYLPDGTRIAAMTQRTGPVNSFSSPITVTLSLPNGNKLICIGTPLKNTSMQGVSGRFQDPLTHRSRVCNALVFSARGRDT